MVFYPRCPNQLCEKHIRPTPGFWKEHGSYRTRTRPQPIPRARCQTCKITFSIQTFRYDYHDHRPDLNMQIAMLLATGLGYRMTARNLGISPSTVQFKGRKLGLHAGLLHVNLRQGVRGTRAYVIDELETFENRSIDTLTVPVLVEAQTWYLIDIDVDSIRRLSAKGTRRRCLQEEEEAANKRKRPDNSRKAVARVLQKLAELPRRGEVSIISDLKSSYPRLVREAFGKDLRSHERTSSKVARTTANPLFPVNVTHAMMRDNLGRLRKKSWLASKKAAYLKLHLNLYVMYRNLIRQRFNRDPVNQTPAVQMGLIQRNLTYEEAFSWRQDWGMLSSHPLSTTGAETIGDSLVA